MSSALLTLSANELVPVGVEIGFDERFDLLILALQQGLVLACQRLQLFVQCIFSLSLVLECNMPRLARDLNRCLVSYFLCNVENPGLIGHLQIQLTEIA